MDVLQIVGLARIVHETSSAHKRAMGDLNTLPWEQISQGERNMRIRSICECIKNKTTSAEDYYRSVLTRRDTPSYLGGYLWYEIESDSFNTEFDTPPPFDLLPGYTKLRVIVTYSIIENFLKWQLGEFATNPSERYEHECHGLDTQTQVFFYEHDFYCLSNFSSFTVDWKKILFATLEHAYHWEKFLPKSGEKDTKVLKNVRSAIRNARSAHVAFELAQRNKDIRRDDWDDVKVSIMTDLMRAKADQHVYVSRKLAGTADRELIEDSWRDSWWGTGPNGKGRNECGKCWMVVREERRKSANN